MINTYQVALITGSSTGIGFQTVLVFARHGYRVYAGVRNRNQGAQILQAVAKDEQLNIHLIEMDITKGKSVRNAIKKIQQEEKSVDVLVNNAGVGFYGPVEAFSTEELKLQYETNVFGTFRVLKEVAPMMRSAKAGVIINVSSINGRIVFPFLGIYASSKFALESVSEALRFELRPFGIHVALVEPGTFLTNFSKNRRSPDSLQNNASFYATKNKEFLDMLRIKEKQIASSFVKDLFNPEKVAKKIYWISQQKNPPFHNLVGIDAFIYYYGKRVVPDFIWNYFLKKIYKYSL